MWAGPCGSRCRWRRTLDRVFTSQYFQFVNLAAEDPWGLLGLSVLFTALAAAAGLVVFQKKDIK